MGFGAFDVSSSSTRAKVRKDTGATAFTHDTAARMGKAPKLHESLNFKLKPQRESRDSVDNPNSTPIAVLCDVTGSMCGIPEKIINELHKFISMVQGKGIITHPSVLFGAIGDATSDQVPIQMGEFEADDELTEKHLSNIYLEGAGGGQNMESYELFMWMFANRVYTDADEKRGEKGYLFIIGDEKYYPTVRKDLVKDYMGLDIEDDIPTATVAEQLQEKWEVFVIRPYGSSNYNSNDVQTAWEKILPAERVIKAETWEQIVPQIAGTISVMAGASISDTVAAMKDAGFDASAVSKAAGSLVPLEGTNLPVVNGGDDALATAEADSVAHGERL